MGFVRVEGGGRREEGGEISISLVQKEYQLK